MKARATKFTVRILLESLPDHHERVQRQLSADGNDRAAAEAALDPPMR